MLLKLDQALTYIKNAPIGKDVLGIGQSSSQSCCVFLQEEKKTLA